MSYKHLQKLGEICRNAGGVPAPAHLVCFMRSSRDFRSDLEEGAVGTANLSSGLVVLSQQLGFHNTYWKAFFSPCIV